MRTMRLRRRYEAEHGLPPTAVLATTGNASAHDVRMYASSGFDGCVRCTSPLALRCAALRSAVHLNSQLTHIAVF